MKKISKLYSFCEIQLDIDHNTLWDLVINIALFFVFAMELAVLYFFVFKVFIKFS